MRAYFFSTICGCLQRETYFIVKSIVRFLNKQVRFELMHLKKCNDYVMQYIFVVSKQYKYGLKQNGRFSFLDISQETYFVCLDFSQHSSLPKSELPFFGTSLIRQTKLVSIRTAEWKFAQLPYLSRSDKILVE